MTSIDENRILYFDPIFLYGVTPKRAMGGVKFCSPINYLSNGIWLFKIGWAVPEIWNYKKSDFFHFRHFFAKNPPLYFLNASINWAKNLVFSVLHGYKFLVRFWAKSETMTWLFFRYGVDRPKYMFVFSQ